MSKAKQPLTMTDQLKRAIVASGLTVYRIAKDSGVPQPVVHRFMAGDQGISLATAEKLARYLKLKLS